MQQFRTVQPEQVPEAEDRGVAERVDEDAGEPRPHRRLQAAADPADVLRQHRRAFGDQLSEDRELDLAGGLAAALLVGGVRVVAARQHVLEERDEQPERCRGVAQGGQREGRLRGARLSVEQQSVERPRAAAPVRGASPR